jgi:hypothetical protein
MSALNQFMIIWSRLAKSEPLDCSRMVFVVPELRVTVTVCVAQVSHEPVGLNQKV